MLGLMTLVWAWAENALAIAIGIIDESVSGVRNNTELPVSMKRKLRYLRAALIDIPALEPVKRQGRLLADRFADLAVRRNELVHGSTWQLEKGGFDSLRFAIVGRQQSAHQKRYEIADAVFLNIEITKLANEACAFLLRVTAIFS
jgi:hypothetical protein